MRRLYCNCFIWLGSRLEIPSSTRCDTSDSIIRCRSAKSLPCLFKDFSRLSKSACCSLRYFCIRSLFSLVSADACHLRYSSGVTEICLGFPKIFVSGTTLFFSSSETNSAFKDAIFSCSLMAIASSFSIEAFPGAFGVCETATPCFSHMRSFISRSHSEKEILALFHLLEGFDGSGRSNPI